MVSSGELFVPGIVRSRWPLLSANELPFSLSLHNLAIVAVQKVLDVTIDTAFAELPSELLLAHPLPGRVKHKDLVKQQPISLLAPVAVKANVFLRKIVARSHIVCIALSNEILLAATSDECLMVAAT